MSRFSAARRDPFGARLEGSPLFDHGSLDHHVHEPLSLFAVRRKLNSFQAMTAAEPMQIVGEPTFMARV